MKKTLTLLIMILFLSATTFLPATLAATEDEIEASIDAGLVWLTSVQNLDGSWGEYDQTAHTAFALIKLQDRAYELGYESPFDPDYTYSENVEKGWDFIFGPNLYPSGFYCNDMTVSLQDHTGGASGSIDDPDSDGDDLGVYFFGPFGSHATYTTGLVLMALEASGTPDRLNDGGFNFDGDGFVDSFFDIAQDAVDWLAFGQVDYGETEGSWVYDAADNSDWWGDNSNSGYAVLGLAAAEGMGCTVPDWLRTELVAWVDYIQGVSGGSGYNMPNNWENELKTGNLIFEMTFLGMAHNLQPFMDAMGYIESHWQDPDHDPGWGYSLDPAHYQAMFCLMKGLEYSQIETIDLSGLGGSPEHDWYQEFADVIISQQNGDGSWSPSMWGNTELATCWALLTLERVIPPPPVIEVPVDIKPGSWPNPLNKKSKGVIPIAICGSDEFDVTTVDPATVLLTLEGVEGNVPPLRWSYEDVAEVPPEDRDDWDGGSPDSNMDIIFHFSTPETVETLELCIFPDGEMVTLMVTGNLLEEHGGTQIQGTDMVWIKAKGK